MRHVINLCVFAEKNNDLRLDLLSLLIVIHYYYYSVKSVTINHDGFKSDPESCHLLSLFFGGNNI